MNKRIIIFSLILVLILQICTISFAVEDETENEDEMITKIEDENVGETGNTNNESDEEKIEWTDFSNAKITVQRNKTSETIVEMKITGIKYQKGHSYQLYIGENKDTIFEDNNNMITTFTNYNNGEYVLATIPGEYFILNKIYYYGIVERYNAKNKTHVEATELTPPALPGLGNRMDIYMFVPKSATTFFKAYSTKQNLKMNYKIGIIDNIDILKKFKTDKNQAFKELLEYAKKSKYLTTGSIDANEDVNFNPADSIKIENGKYYFAYLSLDTENGKYREIEDIAIYQGQSENTLGHFAFADMKFDESDKPTLNNGGVHTTTPTTDEKDPTTAPDKLPYTGKVTLGVIISVLVISTYVFYKKNKNLKDV